MEKMLKKGGAPKIGKNTTMTAYKTTAQKVRGLIRTFFCKYNSLFPIKNFGVESFL